MSDPEVIDELGNPALQRIADLAKPSKGPRRSALIEDPEPLAQALRSGVAVHEVYCDAGREVDPAVQQACDQRGVTISFVDPALLTKVFRTEKRPKIFGVAKIPAPDRLEDILTEPGDVLILDGVKIVGNIGAIVRSAVAFGARAVVLVDSDLTAVVDRRVVRASRGYVFDIPVILADRASTARWLADEWLADPSRHLVDVDMDGELLPSDLVDAPGDVALLLGAERTGGSNELQALATATVCIPLSPSVESLNVSVTAGIVLFSRYAADDS